MALTPKQEAFVREYLIDLNGAQAAIRAGYAESGARTEGSRLLANADIQAAIAEAQAARAERTRIDADWVLSRLGREADADLADLYTPEGAIRPIHEWPKIWRQGLVAGIKHQEIKDAEGNATGDFVVEVKLSDRIKRIELIGKHVNVQAFRDQVAHSGGVTLNVSQEDAEL